MASAARGDGAGQSGGEAIVGHGDTVGFTAMQRPRSPIPDRSVESRTCWGERGDQTGCATDGGRLRGVGGFLFFSFVGCLAIEAVVGSVEVVEVLPFLQPVV